LIKVYYNEFDKKKCAALKLQCKDETPSGVVQGWHPEPDEFSQYNLKGKVK